MYDMNKLAEQLQKRHPNSEVDVTNVAEDPDAFLKQETFIADSQIHLVTNWYVDVKNKNNSPIVPQSIEDFVLICKGTVDSDQLKWTFGFNVDIIQNTNGPLTITIKVPALARNQGPYILETVSRQYNVAIDTLSLLLSEEPLRTTSE